MIVDFTIPLTLDSKLRTISLRLEGNDFTLTQDGVDLETVTDATAAAGSLVLTTIANRNNLNYFNGVISDVKITDGTDLIRSYAIDEDLSATSTIIDNGSDGSNGTAISITESDDFCLDGCSWINGTQTIIISGC